jgi:propanol-preferring alcohol dehydrogenase
LSAASAAFAQAFKMARRKGTISLVSLPPGEVRMPIFDVVMNRITIRGSIVGCVKTWRKQLHSQPKARSKQIHRTKLDTINQVFSDLKPRRSTAELC